MNPTLDDLRSALDDAAASSHAPVDRLVGVRRVVARRKAGRAVVAGAASLALLAGGVTLGTDLLNPQDTAVQPAAGQGKALGEYYAGGRLLAAGELPGKVGATTTITFTPTSYGLALREMCEVPSGRTVALETEVNGRPVSSSSGCGGSSRAGFENDTAYWQGLDVRPGQPSTLSVTVLPVGSMGAIGDTVADADDPAVVVRLGVYQDVPVAEYPFPARPTTLKSVEDLSTDVRQSVAVLGPQLRTVTVGWKENLRASIGAVEPGTVRVLVDGVVVGGASFWDYEGSTSSLFLDSRTLTEAGLPAPVTGQILTITVEAQRFATGAWQVPVGLPA